MGFRQKKTPREKEWDKLLRREERFLLKRIDKKDTFLNQKLGEKVPDKLQSTLETAFYKAFELVFEKGTGVIEKTFSREDLEYQHQTKWYAAQLRENKKNLRAISKTAEKTGTINTLLSGVSGIGLGVLGIGIPDIALFTGMMLKNVYEIALGYGYDYQSEEEQYYILLLVRGAVSYGNQIQEIDRQVNQYAQNQRLPEEYQRKDEIRQTANALSKELLYMKFLQGIPLVGAVGGLYDAVYMNRITEYASIKYKRRFYEEM